MENFVLRFLVALVSSVVAFHLAFNSLGREWGNIFLRHHHERGLGVAVELAISSLFCRISRRDCLLRIGLHFDGT
jgi:hypothetical protein